MDLQDNIRILWRTVIAVYYTTIGYMLMKVFVVYVATNASIWKQRYCNYHYNIPFEHIWVKILSGFFEHWNKHTLYLSTNQDLM